MDSGISMNILPGEASFYIPTGIIATSDISPVFTSHSPIKFVDSLSLIIPVFHNKMLKNDSLRLVLSNICRSRTITQIILVATDELANNYYDLAAQLPINCDFLVVDSEPNNRAKARNRGATFAQSNFLLFIDDDMIIRDWRMVDVILSYLKVNNYDCALFPRRVYLKYPKLFNCSSLGSLVSKWRCLNPGSIFPQIFDPLKEGSPYKTTLFCFPGCFMIISRDSFLRLGGFSEEFVGWGLEDATFAIKATTSLKILNLFCKSDELMHLDHPVSPYKSDEHRENYRRFAENYTSVELDILCDRVITGRNYNNNAEGILHNKPQYLAPLIVANAILQIPIMQETVIRSYLKIVNDRLRLGFEPFPIYFILHGSRGAGTNRVSSDYDVLFLYNNGRIRDFYVHSANGVFLECEYSDADKYLNIAKKPSSYAASGPLELAKIAASILLWGDFNSWHEWKTNLLIKAISLGRSLWYLFAFGMNLAPEKYGSFAERYINCLGLILKAADSTLYHSDIELLSQKNAKIDPSFLIDILDNDVINWREMTTRGIKLYPDQMPEIWRALLWLNNTKI